MCGIIGGVAQRNVTPVLLEGLKRLEYRGYDSAGIVVIGEGAELERLRTVGKVEQLEKAFKKNQLQGETGIAHTRWATHGEPTENNAHPHITKQSIAIVHNGIIENHEHMRQPQSQAGYGFSSQTDTEVVVHSIHHNLNKGCANFLEAVQKTVSELEGAFAIAVMAKFEPHRLIAVRKGSPLIIGVGIGEHYVASDYLALVPVTNRFIILEEGDIADITCDTVVVYDGKGVKVERPVQVIDIKFEAADKGQFRHYMQKEIFYQPEALHATINQKFPDITQSVKALQLVACGTSFHAAKIAKYWFEEELGIPCQVEIASEYRYRKAIVPDNCLFVTLSQSGETADTLAALRLAKSKNYLATLAICNVPGSSLVRESDLVYMTHAGPEIGVASTKAFTAQLAALLSLLSAIGKKQNTVTGLLKDLPALVEKTLNLSEKIKAIAETLIECPSTLFLGRGQLYPIALEGALKLKEISYIHAEAYPAGELKHGPLALVDKAMPIVALADSNPVLLEKLKSNLEEVKARGGRIILFADEQASIQEGPQLRVIHLPRCHPLLAPIVYAIPLQLLAYHVAVLKGTDVDQPRNLAKSVTVE